MRIRNEKGITLITLILTVVILMILATAVIVGVTRSNKQSKSGVLESELTMVQNAVLQRKIQAGLTDTDYSSLPGSNISKSQVESIVEGITLKGEDGDYRLLDKKSLKELGITNTDDSYIVNYKTGETINKDSFNKADKKLYVYATK